MEVTVCLIFGWGQREKCVLTSVFISLDWSGNFQTKRLIQNLLNVDTQNQWLKSAWGSELDDTNIVLEPISDMKLPAAARRFKH